MPNRSTIITVAVLLGVAFFWGYKQEALLAALERTADEPVPVVPGSVVPVPAPAPPADPNDAPIVNAPPPIAPPAPGSPFSPPAGTAARQQNNLTNTLDSIRPGQIQQEQITQRNAYFDKLSQQLRELQGGAPPPPAGQPPDAPPPPPPVEAPPAIPPGYPGSFPPDGSVGAGFPDGQNPYAVPQGDFDQPTAGIEEDDEGEEELVEDDTDLEEEPELAE